jgi:hypothetical protein
LAICSLHLKIKKRSLRTGSAHIIVPKDGSASHKQGQSRGQDLDEFDEVRFSSIKYVFGKTVFFLMPAWEKMPFRPKRIFWDENLDGVYLKFSILPIPCRPFWTELP